MEKIIEKESAKGVKPKLLLHACCAPCASSCIERLKEFFNLTVYFYNPNLDSEKEYNLRAEELNKLCAHMQVECVIEYFNPQEFLDVAKGLETLQEGGKRCENCFALRLFRSAEKAKEGFDYFTTTLTVSPLKNAHTLNQIGEKAGQNHGVKFLPSDFKKKNGYVRSIEISKQLNLYRQNYCGCVFSKREL